jgi:hypothetical protein
LADRRFVEEWMRSLRHVFAGLVRSAFRRQPLFWLTFAVSSIAAAQPVPSELSAWAAKARLEGAIVASCRGEFRSGRPRGYAVAIASQPKGGRYLVVESDATVVQLASFVGGADLSCYTPAAARKLDRAIGESEAIHGQIAPRWRTTIVCGFVEDTRAVCWQYSPASREYVKVGGWIT